MSIIELNINVDVALGDQVLKICDQIAHQCVNVYSTVLYFNTLLQNTSNNCQFFLFVLLICERMQMPAGSDPASKLLDPNLH